MGEWYSPTQPFPTKPVAYARNGVTLDDILDFTPALKEQGVAIASRFKLGPIFTPPVTSKAGGPVATLANGPTNGGTNWPGGSYDPETHTLYVGASNYSPAILGLTPPSEGRSDMMMVQGMAPQPPGTPGGRGITVQGLPLFKPPYGTITAFDMDKGEILWQIPHGETPDAVRNHEALKGLTIPRTGQPGTAGTLVTKTLVIAGDLQVTTVPPRARGAVLRAYDKASGKEVGGVLMPAPQSGSPMTYTVAGRQYLVVAVSGGPYSGEYIALSCSRAGRRAKQPPFRRDFSLAHVRRPLILLAATLLPALAFASESVSRTARRSLTNLGQRIHAGTGRTAAKQRTTKTCSRCHQAALGGADRSALANRFRVHGQLERADVAKSARPRAYDDANGHTWHVFPTGYSGRARVHAQVQSVSGWQERVAQW